MRVPDARAQGQDGGLAVQHLWSTTFEALTSRGLW